MRERIIIVFIAIAIGLLVTTLIFFLYQQTKALPQKPNVIANLDNQPSPTPKNGVLLKVDSPANESLMDKRSIQVKGTTNTGNTIVVSTNQEDVVAEPTSDGAFSVTISIDAGSNIIVTRAIAPNGDEAVDRRLVTYSTEQF